DFSPAAHFGCGVTLVHQSADDSARKESYCGNRSDRPRNSKPVGDDTRRERPDRVTEVSPESIDAQRAGPPCRVRGIGDGRDQAWIDHRRADAKQETAEKPPLEPAGRRGDKQAGGLHPHAGYDQALTPPAVAQGAGTDRPEATGGRVAGS